MQIIDEGGWEEQEIIELEFPRSDVEGSSFAFPCDTNGDVTNLNPDAQRNYEKCIKGEVPVYPGRIRRWTNRYKNPRLGKCDCGETVILDSFTCECEKCGQLYNSSGQKLAPPEQWGWDTGEDPNDILRIR